MERNHLYKVLGVQPNATERDIKKSYHKLAKQFHPDKNNASNAEEKFKEIVTSYDILKDKEKRRVYDLQQETAEIIAQNAKRREEKNKSKSTTRETFYEPSWSAKTEKTQNQKTKADTGKREKKTPNANTTKTNRTFNGKSQNGKKEKQPWRGPLDSDDFTFEDIPGPGPKPSFTFKFSFDHSDPFKSFMEFFKPYRFDEFDDAFFGPNTRDPFEDIYSWGNGTNRNRSENSPSNASGSQNQNGFQFHGVDDTFPSMNCVFCRKNFELKDLKGHEEICKKLHTKPKSPFSFEPELRDGDRWPDSDRLFGRSPSPPYSPKDTSNWRDRHEETINKIRQSKRTARYGMNPVSDPNRGQTEPVTNREDLVECKLCGREFNPTSYRRHQPFCPGVSQGGEFGVKGQRWKKNSNGSQQSYQGNSSPSNSYNDNLFEDEYPRTSTSRRSSYDISNDSPFPPPRQPRGFTQRSWSSMNDEDESSSRFPHMSSKGNSIPTSCHYCGAEYAKAAARFCSECGAKRTYGTNNRF